eukprot:743153-Hanusia_phi.AAC.2
MNFALLLISPFRFSPSSSLNELLASGDASFKQAMKNYFDHCTSLSRCSSLNGSLPRFFLSLSAAADAGGQDAAAGVCCESGSAPTSLRAGQQATPDPSDAAADDRRTHELPPLELLPSLSSS